MRKADTTCSTDVRIPCLALTLAKGLVGVVRRPEVALQEVRLHQPCGQLATHKVRVLVDALVQGRGAEGAGASHARDMHLEGVSWQCLEGRVLGRVASGAGGRRGTVQEGAS